MPRKSVYFSPPELVDQIEAVAGADQRSFSQWVSMACHEKLAADRALEGAQAPATEARTPVTPKEGRGLAVPPAPADPLVHGQAEYRAAMEAKRRKLEAAREKGHR